MYQNINKIYHAAIYVRLSKEDGDISSSAKLESNSISNQKALILDFLKDKKDIEVVSVRVDDGYLGSNFERPAFQAMLEDIRRGIVDCVVVKDLSRFGREYIDSGKYIERLFPALGVRFIAINDNYDSLKGKNQADEIIIPFKNLINDAYCRDISIKIRSNLEIKRKKGECVTPFVAFGYRKTKTDKHKLEIDPSAGSVVQDIFKMKLQGMSQDAIANRLNELGILSPFEYKISNGSRYETGFRQKEQALWSSVTVRRILENEVYIGNLVQGKRTTPNHKVKQTYVKPEDDWIRIEKNHEPLVSDRDFEIVQRLLGMDTHTSPDQKQVYLLSGIAVKDLSRLGRNYVETSNYIERVFPFFHVRFLAVTDDFDSFREGVDLTVPLKNIINEFYSKDLAKKSSSAKKALWKKGKFTSAWEPYGYRKSEEDHHQLIVDEEAAEHLKSIFSMYMDGRNYSDIARQLNKDGVLSPTLQRKFYKTGEKPLPESKPWNNYEVKRVLQDVHCTGDSVFGKYQQSVFQGNKQRNRPESEWVHVENTHEGIIDRELFQQVQSKIQEYTEAYKKKHQQNNGAIRNHNFYTGKIWCGGCGNRMTLSRERNGTFFYICGANTNHKSGGKQCKGHRVRKEYVDDDVLRLIQTHMKTVLDTEKMIQEMNAASKNQTQYLLLDKEVGKLRRELSRISKRKSDLYEDYSERLITEEEYIQFSRIYSNEIENIKSRLDTVLAAQVRYSQDYHIEEGWGNVIHTYMSKRKLTKEMADAFVDSIIIHGKYDYEIKLVYDDQFADLQKLKKEKEAQSR